MKAFVLDSFDTPPAVRDDLPEPVPGDNELLVRVHASSVNPVDVHLAAGALKGMVDYEFPVTIGRDFAGVVEQTGSSVSEHRVGDEVFGFLLHANPTESMRSSTSPTSPPPAPRSRTAAASPPHSAQPARAPDAST